MPLPSLLSFQQVSGQDPLNAIGKKAQLAFVGSHRVLFAGQTGRVSTDYGIPGVSVQRVTTGGNQTGYYSVQYPPVAGDITFHPNLQVPTGFGGFGTPQIITQNNATGTAVLRIERQLVNSAAATPSGPFVPSNPPDGAQLVMLAFVAPVVPY